MSTFDESAGRRDPAPPAVIHAIDSYGRAVQIPRETWRQSILPDQVRRHWDDAVALGQFVAQSLADGFAADVLPAAHRCAETDPVPRRGALYLAVTLLELGRHAEAESVLVAAIAQHGADGPLLTNLAKAQAARGDDAESERTLWRAVEADPNFDNPLLWYAAIQRERGGAEAEQAAFRRVAALPHAWRAQIWLARAALERKDKDAALALHREALRRAGRIPADALMQITGDLGNHGHLAEIVSVCEGVFDPAVHGLEVGNNLIKAHVDLGHADAARAVLERLHAMNRPDWRPTLLFWDDQVDRIAPAPPLPAGKPRLGFLGWQSPLWAEPGSPFASLVPAKGADAPRILFVCGTAEVVRQGGGEGIAAGPTDAPGRVSRGLQAYLAERVHLGTAATTSLVVPWIQDAGFALLGEPWTPEALAGCTPRPQFFVVLHLTATASPWRAHFRLLRGDDFAEVRAWTLDFDPDAAEPAIEASVAACMDAVCAAGGVAAIPPPPACGAPHADWVKAYLIATEQGLAVLSARSSKRHDFLYSPRSLFDHLLHVSLGCPDAVPPRGILLRSLASEAGRSPALVAEYRDKVRSLQRAHPLAPPADAAEAAMIAQIWPGA